jgi:hypothetical protein
MTGFKALRKRCQFLLEQLSQAVDEIGKIDERLTVLLEGRKGQGGAGAA